MKNYFFYTPAAQQAIADFNSLVERIDTLSFEDPEYSKTQQRLFDYRDFLDQFLEVVKGKTGKMYFSAPRVTVMGTKTDTNFVFTVSRCSAQDSFMKKQGKKICSERLEKQKVYKSIPLEVLPDQNFSQWFINECRVISNEVLFNSHLVK